ncbi:MAG: hypothetical protein ACD_81C00151G0001 [uncultured bacterium]|uniref:Uncharacterized protein n=2 Tax=Candidatus Wolfeibacteriota TaxID=1752735 RepID=A0A0G1K600_9BACT|nr:MAG: hypothetical protein ACD_81C00151G0001 [uncultured bacterium]KKR12356.1 MAG: hypothetical protein UT41_C0002G0130 [Candidatus Wolfebacteria bacterium GW2011_GWC2_39_22]KKT43264.1 MAG: hypothetical protein UW32_C0002G0125 [Candidatus Wolfebacteria bacterium GW2011_GWE2_44_13]HBI25982.1 hypothetical protein [Candidatus Wolfebacteria bacterium]
MDSYTKKVLLVIALAFVVAIAYRVAIMKPEADVKVQPYPATVLTDMQIDRYGNIMYPLYFCIDGRCRTRVTCGNESTPLFEKGNRVTVWLKTSPLEGSDLLCLDKVELVGR